MNNLKTILFLLLSATVMTAGCSKDDDPVPEEEPGIAGFWVGKYGTGDDYPTSSYAFLFRKNGTVRVYGDADTAATEDKAEGTYSVSGSTVNTTYTYPNGNYTYSTTASVDPNFTFMEGTWGDGNNTSGGGKFFINKQ